MWPWQRKQKKKEWSGKLAIRPDHPRRRIEVKVCMPGGLRCVVLYFKFYYNRSSGFAAVGGRKSAFPISLAIGLYNSSYYRTSRDGFWNTARYWSKIAICSYWLHSTPPVTGASVGILPYRFVRKKLEWCTYLMVKKTLIICLAVSTEYQRFTDRQAGRRTDKDGRADICRQHNPR